MEPKVFLKGMLYYLYLIGDLSLYVNAKAPYMGMRNG